MLHSAVALGGSFIPQLIAAGARIRRGRDGFTPLHEVLASTSATDEKATRLLKRLLAAPNAREMINKRAGAPHERNCTLGFAAFKGFMQVCECGSFQRSPSV